MHMAWRPLAQSSSDSCIVGGSYFPVCTPASSSRRCHPTLAEQPRRRSSAEILPRLDLSSTRGPTASRRSSEAFGSDNSSTLDRDTTRAVVRDQNVGEPVGPAPEAMPSAGQSTGGEDPPRGDPAESADASPRKASSPAPVTVWDDPARQADGMKHPAGRRRSSGLRERGRFWRGSGSGKPLNWGDVRCAKIPMRRGQETDLPAILGVRDDSLHRSKMPLDLRAPIPASGKVRPRRTVVRRVMQ